MHTRAPHAEAAPPLVHIPAGNITLTDARARRSWTVQLEAFEIGVYPVTQAEYSAVLSEQPSMQDGERMPVVDVSWFDAVRFCNALSLQLGLDPAYQLSGEPDEQDVHWNAAASGFRLPTEAEWEYACRAGTSGPRYGPRDEIAWYRDNSEERLHAVGEKTANAWGLHDTIGNVWEWCWDFSDVERYGYYRVMRGGGWFDQHWSCRASVRRNSYPGLAIDDVGFRVARSLSSASRQSPES